MMSEPAPEPIQPGAFWGALGARATGVAIVTAKGEAGPEGCMVLSATHLCAAPPIMTVAISGTTSALGVILESRAFAINYLSQANADIYGRFTAKGCPAGSARFEGLELKQLQTGSPVFAGVTGALDCQLEEVIERHGTHLLLGRLVAFEKAMDRAPMVHFDGQV